MPVQFELVEAEVLSEGDFSGTDDDDSVDCASDEQQQQPQEQHDEAGGDTPADRLAPVDHSAWLQDVLVSPRSVLQQFLLVARQNQWLTTRGEIEYEQVSLFVCVGVLVCVCLPSRVQF